MLYDPSGYYAVGIRGEDFGYGGIGFTKESADAYIVTQITVLTGGIAAELKVIGTGVKSLASAGKSKVASGWKAVTGLFKGTDKSVFKVGTKSEAIQALKELPDSVQSNVKRFIKKSGSGYTQYSVDVLKNGNYQVSMIKPGNYSGHAEYFKIIDPKGNTIETFKDTFDNFGKLVHRKYK